MPESAIAWLVITFVVRALIPRDLMAEVLWHLRAWVLVIGLVVTALAWYGATH